MHVLQHVLDNPTGRRWIAQKRRGRCMEHTMHLGAKSFIEGICPTPLHPKKAAVTVIDDAGEDYNDGDDQNGSSLSVGNFTDESAPEDEEIDDVVEFDAGDTLGKVLALINQVCVTSKYCNYEITTYSNS